MLEGDILDHLINPSQDSDLDAQHLCINVFTALVPLGTCNLFVFL